MTTSASCVHSAAVLLMQSEAFSFRWAYVWLGAGGVLLILALLAFGYILAREHRQNVIRLVRSSAFQRVDYALSRHAGWLWHFLRRRFSVENWHGLALTVVTVVVFAALYLFVLISESWIEQDALYAFDQRVYGWLMGAADSRIIVYMEWATHLGDGLVVTAMSVIVGLVLIARRYRWEVLSLALSVGVGAALMNGLKWMFERSRPAEQIIQVGGHSFPSGHAFLATTLYGWLIYAVWRFAHSDSIRIGFTIVLSLIIFFVGLSRIILRVHWTSDVAGGITVGLAWLICSLVLVRFLRSHNGNAQARETRSTVSDNLTS